jgi:hypothetical protein
MVFLSLSVQFHVHLSCAVLLAPLRTVIVYLLYNYAVRPSCTRICAWPCSAPCARAPYMAMEFSVNAVTYMALVGNIGTYGAYMALENRHSCAVLCCSVLFCSFVFS